MQKYRTILTVAPIVSLMLLSVAGSATASSHREAPYVTQQPAIDATDFYMFNSYEDGREDFVTFIANYVPLQDAYGGPNYFALDPNALYEIHIDNDGDAIEDITFQWRFENSLGADTGVALNIGGESVAIPLKLSGPISAESTAAANFDEKYMVSMVTGDRRSGTRTDATDEVISGSTTFKKPLDFFGDKTFGGTEGYEDYVRSVHNSGSAYHNISFEGCAIPARVFAGQRKESFSVNLGRIFDLVNFNPIGLPDNENNNLLADKNITTLALEVHKDCVTGGQAGNGVIGAWTTASSQQIRVLNPTATFERAEVVGGAWTQVSRLGSPLVNEVVIGLPDKNRFNASEPKDDGNFAVYVTNPTLPAILDLLFNSDGGLNPNGSIAPSNYPRGDLVAAFLTGFAGVNQLGTVTASEMLRLNTGIPATAAGNQSNFGVVAGDAAGFPNGRRPGDDVTDLALRVVIGALCHNIAFDVNADGAVDEADNLGLCGGTNTEENEAAAPAGTAPLGDGSPQNAAQFDSAFPYLTTPLSGSRIAGDGS